MNKLPLIFVSLGLSLFVVACGNSSSSSDSVSSDTSGSTSNSTKSYQNETWFSLSAQACATDNDALYINNGFELVNQKSDDLSCTIYEGDDELVYSIRWVGSDFDRDGVNDTFTYDLRVEGFSGSTYSYSETAGESSMTELGEPAAPTTWIDDEDDSSSVWDVEDGNGTGLSAGQSLRFTIENAEASVSGYNADFNGFNYIEVMETDGGREHTHIRGEGTDLDSASFDTSTSTYSFDDVDEFVITGSGDYYSTKTWGITNIQFSFSITNPDLVTVWDVMDYSRYGIGPMYGDVYPEEETARQELFPEFSWDTMPRWLAVRNSEAYTDEQIETIANNYQLVMLEKANKAGFDTIDEGIKDTASRLKAINPDIKIIFYWNTQIHYTGYSSDDEYEENVEEWSTLNDDGSIYMFKDLYYWYDESVEGLRDWWIDFPVTVVSDENIDGVFIDKMPEAAVDPLFIDGEPVTDYIDMINTLWGSMPEDKLLMGNNLRGERDYGSRAAMEILDGSYLERWAFTYDDWELPEQTTADAISISIQLMREALAQGKFINFQTSPWTDEEVPDNYDDKLVYMEEYVDFPLAVFLIAAEENAFFSYQLSVDAKTSTASVWDSSYIDELTRNLGEPLGDPVKEGYIYTRSYEYVDVWLDLEAEEAVLTWRDEALSAD